MLAKNVRKPEDLHNQALHALFMSCLIHTQCKGLASLSDTRHPSVREGLNGQVEPASVSPEELELGTFKFRDFTV